MEQLNLKEKLKNIISLAAANKNNTQSSLIL